MENYEIVNDIYVVTLETGKTVKIMKNFLQKNYIEGLGLDEEDAILTWLEDEEYLINDEQEELNKEANGAKKYKVNAEKAGDKPRKKREVVKKENPTKKSVIDAIAQLMETMATNVVIENDTKLITFDLNGESFKIDLVQKRKPKENK